jgi:N-acetylglucosaminyldiphosphoundecaprenol N-acetyl-beta-D-mannosaminyltransferase
MPVHAISMGQAVTTVMQFVSWHESRMVCAADVHMVMRHHDETGFRDVMASADLVTPDGMPLVWLLRRQGFPRQERVCGPDLTLALCQVAAEQGIPIGLYGGKEDVLEALTARLTSLFPGLRVVYSYSPPFRPLDEEEDRAQVEAIRKTGVRMLCIGLGCPKQERWMAAHKGRIPAVMLGVGAAFDFHSGKLPRAPRWMQRSGLEWLYRIAKDPVRIGNRVLRYHTRFVFYSISSRLKGA